MRRLSRSPENTPVVVSCCRTAIGLVKAGWLGRKTGTGFYRYKSTGHDAKNRMC